MNSITQNGVFEPSNLPHKHTRLSKTKKPDRHTYLAAIELVQAIGGHLEGGQHLRTIDGIAIFKLGQAMIAIGENRLLPLRGQA